MVSATRLSSDAWVAAAYRRFHEEGLSGVRIEAIARDLRTTKGSFYHHFADRAALVSAVMERWAREQTEHFVIEADAGSGPRERLEVLFRAIGERRIPGEASLYLDAEREGVGDRVREVTDRRVSYVASALTELGIEPDEARRRALAAVGIALGLELLARGGAGSLVGHRGNMTRSLLELLTAR
jgi:AcrR family transcriptional regulator